MQISTSIGGLGIRVQGQPKAGQLDKLAEIAGKALIFHNLAGKVFRKDKNGAGHKRDDNFSEQLGKDAKAAAEALFSPLFDGLVVEASPYVKPAAKADMEKAQLLRDCGVPEEVIREKVPGAFPAEPEVAVEPADDTEVVG